MPGIRDQKKQRTRDTILKVSKRLFLQQGYDKTTTEQIAAEARIGAGTIFNYFPSKADLMVAILAAEAQSAPEQAPRPADLPKQTPASVICDLLARRTQLFDRWGKELLREILAASVSAFKTGPQFLQNLFQFDLLFIRELEDTIRQLPDAGFFKRAADGKEAAEVIYSIVMYEFLAYLFAEGQTYEACLRRIRGKLERLLNG